METLLLKPRSLPFPEDWGKAVRDVRDEGARDLTLITLLLQNAIFDREWMIRNVSPGRKGGFFSFAPDKSNAFQVQCRLLVMAESIFNLNRYEIGGFEEFIETLRNDPSEGRFAELNLAVGMARSGCRFHFHHPAKPPVHGDNYDFDIVMSDGTLLPAEAKCRLQDTRPDVNKIRSKLKKAGNKLPAGRPGIILMQTPVDWLSDAPAELEEAVDATFRNFSRVVSVTALASFQNPYRAGMAIRYRYREFHSQYHGFDKERRWSVFSPTNTVEWWSIPDMVDFYVNGLG